MKKVIGTLLFFTSIAYSSEKEPLLKKTTQENSNAKIFIAKIKNETQQTLKLVINDEIRFVSKPKTSSSLNIPLSFEDSEKLSKLQDKIQIFDDTNNPLAKLGLVIDSSDPSKLNIISFISMNGKRDSIGHYKIKPKKTYNAILYLEGKNLEKVRFEFN